MNEDNNKMSIISYIFGQSDEMILKRLFYPSSVKCSKSSAHLVGAVTLFLSKIVLIYLSLSKNLLYGYLTFQCLIF